MYLTPPKLPIPSSSVSLARCCERFLAFEFAHSYMHLSNSWQTRRTDVRKYVKLRNAIPNSWQYRREGFRDRIRGLASNTVTPIECLHYALNLHTSVVITGIDSMEILDQAFEAVRTFQPMNDEQVRSLLAKTAEAASSGEFEPFKTSSIYDATAQNPDWLGEEPQRIQQLMSA